MFDERQQRVSVLDSMGTLLGEVRLDPPGGSGLTLFTHGSVLVTRTAWPVTLTSGVARHPVSVIRYSEAGRMVDTLLTVEGPELLISVYDRAVGLQPAPAGRNTVFSVHRERIFFGTQAEREIRVRGDTGLLLGILRWTGDAFEAGTPAFGWIVVDALGRLWVEVSPVDSTGPHRWLVFDPLFTLLGTLMLPAQFTPLEIGTDYALGRWTREDGAEEVRLYTVLQD